MSSAQIFFGVFGEIIPILLGESDRLQVHEGVDNFVGAEKTCHTCLGRDEVGRDVFRSLKWSDDLGISI